MDLVLGVSQYPMLPRAIEEALAGKRPSYCAPEPTVLCGERVLTTAPYTAYVRIADGVTTAAPIAPFRSFAVDSAPAICKACWMKSALWRSRA